MEYNLIDLKTDSFTCGRAHQEDVPALAALASTPAGFDSSLSLPFVHRNLCAELCHFHWDLPLTVVAKTKDQNETLRFATLNASGKNHRQSCSRLPSVALREQTLGDGIGSGLLSQLIRACDTYNQPSRLNAMIWVDNAPLLRVCENSEFEIDERIKNWVAGPVGFYHDFFCVRLDLAFVPPQAS